jgi:hypothetical protein
MRPLMLAILLLVSAPAWGQAVIVVDEDSARAAIDRELEGIDRGGDIDILLPGDGTVTLTYTGRSGRIVGRKITLPPRPEDALETIALLAANLVRDQVGDFRPTPVSAPPPPPAPPTTRDVPAALGLFWPATTDALFSGRLVHTFSLHAVAGTGHAVRGVAISGAVDVRREVSGVQLSGAVNVADRTDGLQLTGAVNVAHRLRGVQIAGGVNVAGETRGFQLAPINVARRGGGFQLGVVNYAESKDGVSLGVISIVRGGITEVDAYVDSTASVAAVLRHGRPHFYQLYGGATTFTPSESVQLAGLGFGSRVARIDRFEVDLALMSWAVEGSDIDAGLSLLSQVRVTVAMGFGRFAVFAGATANVYVADSGETGEALHPALDKTWTSDDVTTRLWPSFSVGLRLR